MLFPNFGRLKMAQLCKTAHVSILNECSTWFSGNPLENIWKPPSLTNIPRQGAAGWRDMSGLQLGNGVSDLLHWQLVAAGGSCNTTSCELWSNIRPWMAQEFQRWLIKNSFAESMMGTSTTWEIDWSGLRPFFLGRLCRSLCRIYSSCSWCCCMLLPGVTVLRYVVWYVCVTCVLSFWSYIYLGPPFHVRFFDKRRCEKTRGNLIKTTMQNLCHLYLEHVSLRGSRYQYYLWEVEVPLEASPSKDSVFLFFNVCFSFAVHVLLFWMFTPKALFCCVPYVSACSKGNAFWNQLPRSSCQRRFDSSIHYFLIVSSYESLFVRCFPTCCFYVYLCVCMFYCILLMWIMHLMCVLIVSYLYLFTLYYLISRSVPLKISLHLLPMMDIVQMQLWLLNARLSELVIAP